MDPWRPYVAVGPASQHPMCPPSRHDAPGRVDSAILPLALSLSLSLIVFSASPPSLRRARKPMSRCLQPMSSEAHVAASSTQCFARVPVSPSSCWLQLPSLGKPTLPSPSRAHLVGVPPWSLGSWPGLFSRAFLFVLVPEAPPCHADARRGSLLPVSDQRRRRLAAHHHRAANCKGEVPRVR